MELFIFYYFMGLLKTQPLHNNMVCEQKSSCRRASSDLDAKLRVMCNFWIIVQQYNTNNVCNSRSQKVIKLALIVV